MNWEMLGAIGEIVGAAGVIVSLIYLARQIRVSNQAARERTVQELLDRTQSQMDQLTRQPEFAGTFARGAADFGALSAKEQMQLRGFYLVTAMNWARFHHLEKSQAVEDWTVHTWRAIRRDVVATPGFRTWFEERKHWVDPEFRSVLESEIAETEESSAVFPSPD